MSADVRTTRSLRSLRQFRSTGVARGFTLIELLVVIAIISVLMALVLPAVQQVRETARKAECRNRLMRIGLALHNYEMSFEVLPPGVLNPNGPIKSLPEGYDVGWLLHLLPYLDQNVVYNRFDFGVGVYDKKQDEIRALALPALYCPSNVGEQLQISGDQKLVGISSFAGCSHHTESPIDATNSGVLFLNSHIRYEDVTDGTANTLFIGEKLTETGDLGWASGTRASLRTTSGLNQPSQKSAAPQTNPVQPVTLDPLMVGGFGSHHPGGANFLMGDGSVHYISEYVDRGTFPNLGNRADGQLPGDF